MNHWKVLVVDDEPEILANIKSQLLQMNLDSRLAGTYTEAGFLIDHYSFDIAILDLILPDGNGIDLFRALRRKNEELYTIMITGNATIENAITALNEGINAYLVKPFTKEQLKANLIQADKNLILKAENKSLFLEIQNNRQFYEDLLNSTSEAIIVIDLDSIIQFSNHSAQLLFGVDEEELLNQSLHQYLDDGFKVLSHIHQQLILNKSVAGYRVSVINQDGKMLDAYLSADFLHDKQNHLQGTIINLTNPLIMEEGFNRLIRKEKLNTIVKLANALGHEIRNPLNILSGRLQLLSEEIKDSNFQNAYLSISRQVERLSNIIKFLGKFNFSREDTIPEILPINILVSEILQEKKNLYQSKKIKTKLSLGKKGLLVEGSVSQFKDAFRHLIEALAEYTPENESIEIIGKIKNRSSEKPLAELQFILSGTRITTQDFFDPHQDIQLKTHSLVGLGMAIMQMIFTNYGAQIETFLQDGNNTILRIRFPFAQTKSSTTSSKNPQKIKNQKER